MKKTLLALSTAVLVAGTVLAPAASYAAEAPKYYLLTDCSKVANPEECRASKVLPGMILGGFFGLMTGGIAFVAAGGAIAAGSTATILGTTVGVETALAGGAVTGALATGLLTQQ